MSGENISYETWRKQIQSMGPLPPPTKRQRSREQYMLRMRKLGGGARTYPMTAEALQDLYWVYDHTPIHPMYKDVLHDALKLLAIVHQAALRGEHLSQKAMDILERLASETDTSTASVADFAVRFLDQELRKHGKADLDPPTGP